jgi:hypothetical protein
MHMRVLEICVEFRTILLCLASLTIYCALQESLLQRFCRLFNPSSLPSLSDEQSIERHIAGAQKDLQALLERYGKTNTVAAPLVGPSLLAEYPMFVRVARQIVDEYSAAEQKLAMKEKRQTVDISMQEMLRQFLVSANARVYRDVATIAEIALIMPLSTAVVERGFSTMNLIKTELRSLLSQRMINALMLIFVEGPKLDKFDFHRAVFTWYERSPRKIKL